MSERTSSPQPQPRGSRGRSASRRLDVTLGDMVRGVVLLGVGVVLVGWFLGLFRNDTVVEPDAVDYAAVAEQAQPGAPFALVVPSSLPEGWRATSARFDPGDDSWHVGILTEDDRYAGIEQSAEDAARVVEEFAGGSVAAGSVEIAGRPWRRLVDAGDGEVTLVRRGAQATTLVTGSAPQPSLVLLAGGLDV